MHGRVAPRFGRCMVGRPALDEPHGLLGTPTRSACAPHSQARANCGMACGRRGLTLAARQGTERCRFAEFASHTRDGHAAMHPKGVCGTVHHFASRSKRAPVAAERYFQTTAPRHDWLEARAACGSSLVQYAGRPIPVYCSEMPGSKQS